MQSSLPVHFPITRGKWVLCYLLPSSNKLRVYSSPAFPAIREVKLTGRSAGLALSTCGQRTAGRDTAEQLDTKWPDTFAFGFHLPSGFQTQPLGCSSFTAGAVGLALLRRYMAALQPEWRQPAVEARADTGLASTVDKIPADRSYQFCRYPGRVKPPLGGTEVLAFAPNSVTSP